MLAFDNNVHPFVPRSQECSLHHPSNGRQVWIRIIAFGLKCLSILYLHARRCTDAWTISFLYSWTLQLLELPHYFGFFFQLFYFAQFAWWKMLWAWTVDVNSLRAAAVESYWKNQAQGVSINFKAHAQCSVCSKLNKKCRAWISFRPSQKHLISAYCARVKEGFNNWLALTDVFQLDFYIQKAF